MTCWKSSANVRPDPQTSQNVRAYCRPTLKSVTHLPVGATFHQTILPGLLLYLMKGSFPRYSSLYFLVPVMCQGNQRPMKRILLIRLEETPPQTGLNEELLFRRCSSLPPSFST